MDPSFVLVHSAYRQELSTFGFRIALRLAAHSARSEKLALPCAALAFSFAPFVNWMTFR